MPYRATKHTRAKQAATRERILDAARQLLSEGGYAAVLVAVVAQRAGVATGTVYLIYSLTHSVVTQELPPSPPESLSADHDAFGL